ncbi:hypothetical protein ACFRR7_27425 [Streptomyces sp. NPDC056909]|uniref:hypothetical protein n=1 Tax=Streptomyces sp. NPDC056909 TaxID=3345963 RepID=UPI003685CF38
MTSLFDSFRLGNASHSPGTTLDAIAEAFDAGFRHFRTGNGPSSRRQRPGPVNTTHINRSTARRKIFQ